MKAVYRQKISDAWAENLTHWLDQHHFAFCFRGKGWGSFDETHPDILAGFGEKAKITSFESAEKIHEFVQTHNEHIICHLTYDVKNRLEKLNSCNVDLIDFPELQLTVPKVVFKVFGNEVEVLFSDETHAESDVISMLDSIEQFEIKPTENSLSEANFRLTKTDYLQALIRLKTEIKLGNIYQANFCQEVYWENANINAATVFNEGFDSNPNPFSVFYKIGNHYCLSFSPERFVAIVNGKMFSQPMKGTAPRGETPEMDEQNKKNLRESEKDRRENVMIVDMVRNDLSHFAKAGSVCVPELYKIETYPRVHQMYSTVEAELKDPKLVIDALLKCFPMGSMTGAPKVSAMRLIEETEQSKRGMFSGTIGYFTPQKNGDFNVIIRSLIYNKTTQKLSCHVGGGITDWSDIEAEYEECMVKLKPILHLVNSIGNHALT